MPIDVNNVRVYWYAAPQVCLVILDIVRAKLVPFFNAYWMWCLKDSLWSKITPKYLALLADLIIVSPMSMCAVVCQFLFFVKWMRMYLLISNLAQCPSLHFSIINILLNSFAFSSSLSPWTQICTSVDAWPRSDRRWLVNVESSLGLDLLLLGSGWFSMQNSPVCSRANGSTDYLTFFEM